MGISTFTGQEFTNYLILGEFKIISQFFQIPSEWAVVEVELLLLSVILVNESFNDLNHLQTILAQTAMSIGEVFSGYKAFYIGNPGFMHSEIDNMKKTKTKIINVLNQGHLKLQAAIKKP